MAQHGYLGGSLGSNYDPDYDERDRNWRQGRTERGFTFEDRDRERSMYRPREQNEERGLFSRVADEARSWLGDDDDKRRTRPASEHRGSASHSDDHYINWRAKQLEALDRDYRDYCREREQQFHQDFESWRSGRRSSPGRIAGESDELILGPDQRAVTGETLQEPQATDPASGASLRAKPGGGRNRK